MSCRIPMFNTQVLSQNNYKINNNNNNNNNNNINYLQHNYYTGNHNSFMPMIFKKTEGCSSCRGFK